MATGDMVARLVLDGQEFELSLKKAKDKAGKFGKEIDKSTSKADDSFSRLIGTVKKFAAAVGVIEVSRKLFDTWVNSSQSNIDSWGRVVMSTKTIWENFANSLLTWDWSAWENGIDDMIDKANAFYDAVDRLNNIRLSYSFLSENRTYRIKEAQLRARDENLSVRAREDAYHESEREIETLENSAIILKESVLNAIRRFVDLENLPSGFAFNPAAITLEDIEKVLEYRALGGVDVKGIRSLIQNAGTDYLTHQRRLDKLIEATEKALKEGTVVEGKEEDAKNMLAKAYELKNRTLEQYTYDESSRYSNDLLLYTLLEKASDEELENIHKWYSEAVGRTRAVTELKQSNMEVSKIVNSAIDSYADYIEEISTWKIPRLVLPGTTGKLQGMTLYDDGGTGAQSRFEVPALPEYGGKYGFWKYNENPIQRTGGLEAMTALPFDAEALKQLIADDELTAWAAKNREEFDKWGTSLNLLGGAFSSLGTSIGGASGELFTFVGGLIDAAQQMLPFIAQIMAETAARNANATAATTEAAAKSMSAYAGIPIVGIGLGLAAVAAIVSAVRSVPKFAEGGIVTSATLGVFGEAGPEAVMPLDRLEEFVTGRDVRVTGNIKASGKELVVVLDNYNRVRNG